MTGLERAIQLRLIGVLKPLEQALDMHHKWKMVTNQRTLMDTPRKKFPKRSIPKTKKMKIPSNRKPHYLILIHPNIMWGSKHISIRRN